jgi:hypothetical protein
MWLFTGFVCLMIAVALGWIVQIGFAPAGAADSGGRSSPCMAFIRSVGSLARAVPYSNAGDKPWQTAALSGTQRIQDPISERAAAIC